MSQDVSNVQSVTDYFARAVRRYRAVRGWTQPELARRCQAAGLRWDRSIVANVEGGRRAAVTVQELVTLSYVLAVPPPLLLLPLGSDHDVAVLPRSAPADPYTALAQLLGDAPLLDQDDPAQVQAWKSNAVPLAMFQEHQAVVQRIRACRSEAQDHLVMAERASVATGNELRARGIAAEVEAAYQETILKKIRSRMRTHGLLPPALPTELGAVAE